MAELPKREKLYDYLPLFMQSFGEMKEIFKSVDIEFDDVYSAISFIIDNCFIDSADEYGISKYEKVLGILPVDDEDLEIRRARVKIRWNDYLPYTVRALREKFDGICGVGKYQLDEQYEDYYIGVRTQLVSDTVLDEVALLLEQILPSNMAYEVGQLYNTHGNLKVHTHGYLKDFTHKTIKEDVDL